MKVIAFNFTLKGFNVACEVTLILFNSHTDAPPNLTVRYTSFLWLKVFWKRNVVHCKTYHYEIFSYL